MANRLANESSLYLRQHADNPVDWHPWGEEAFEAARAADKPVLVSIGYSACHWCHVMAHECFEDAYIAGLMNEHFVCIKVDREERPDVDQVYIEAVQMLQQHAGWPLNAFCFPDGRPFFGGTYFPPEDRGQGIVPWPQVLMRVSDYYQRKRDELEENAHAIQQNLLAGNRTDDKGSSSAWDNALLVDAARAICGNHDDRFGGFGGAPKFPPAMSLDFLFTIRESKAVAEGDPALGRRIDTVAQTTLRAMALGGVYDQFGGGFARYAVDAHWTVPHFEKMLYDNALLIGTYTRGWLGSGDPLFEAVVDETVAWLEREMSSPSGGCYASLDADSDGEEGRFYVWTPDEVKAVLGEERGAELCAAYGITDEGNFENGRSNPVFQASDFERRQAFAEDREALRRHRESARGRPGRDPKINTAWNCLLARSLAEAAFAFNRPEWLDKARAIADFVWERASYDKANGDRRIHAVFYEETGPSVPGFLHDYGLAAEACLAIAGVADWAEPGASGRYLERARRFADTALRRFKDDEAAGFFFTADDVPTPVARRKEWFDNATPSGNSTLLRTLVGLRAVTGESAYERVVGDTLPAFIPFAEKIAAGIAHTLTAATEHAMGAPVIHAHPEGSLDALRDALADRPWRRRFIFAASGDEAPRGYQVCVGAQCMAPSEDPRATAELV